MDRDERGRGTRRARRALGVAFAGLAAGSALVDTVPAMANHGMSTGPDNLDQRVRELSLTSKGNVASDWGQIVLNGTEYRTVQGSWLDIDVHDGFVGNTGWRGSTDVVIPCPASPRGFDCDLFKIVFNLSYPASDGLWKATGCHEFGHTMGLGHRPYGSLSCMGDPQPPGSPRTALDAHDTATANARF